MIDGNALAWRGVLATLLCALWLPVAVPGAAEVPEREFPLPAPGSSAERALSGGQSHAYLVDLGAGTYLRATVEQKGIDVVLQCQSPSAETLLEVDSPTGRHGAEIASFVAPEAGTYRIVVTAPSASAVPGTYVIRTQASRPATAEDRRRTAAEKARAEAYRLEVRRTPESMRRSVGLYEDALGSFRELGDRESEAEISRAIGTVHRLLGENTQALERFGPALVIDRERGDRRAQARTLNQIGLAHWALSQNAPAREALESAIALWRALDEPQQEARVLNNLGLLHYNSGRLDEAFAAYRRALEVFRSAGELRAQVVTLNNLGLVLAIRGRPREALAHHRQALELARAEGYRRQQAEARNGIATVYSKQGEVQEALDHFTAALAGFRELGDRRRQAAVLANLANLHVRLHQPERALDFLDQALTLQKEVGDRRGQGRSLDHLGWVYAELDQFEKARAMYEEALAIRRGLEDRRGEAATLIGLGFAWNSSAQPERALAPLRRGLELSRELDDRIAEARIGHELGRAYAFMNQPRAALGYLDQALGLARATGDRARETFILLEMARLETATGALDPARAHAEAGLGLVESLRSDLAAEELRTSLFADLCEAYELYVELMMRLDRRDPAAGFAALAFAASERARARSLLDLLREAQVDLRRGVDPELLESERDLRWRINAGEERRRRLETAGSADAAAAAARELDRLLTEYHDLRGRIRARSPHYAALTQPPAVSLATIQQQLDEETLLLEVALGEERSFLWAVTSASFSSFELPARSELEDAAREVYATLSVLDVRGAERRRQALARLGRMLLGPVRSQLSRKRLAIVADGALGYVPFAALPSPARPSTPLVVDHEIVSLPSATVLVELRRPRPDRPAVTAAVAVIADPVFTAGDPRLGGALPATAGSAIAQDAGAVSGPGTALRGPGVDFRRLRWSRREAEAIAEVVRPRAAGGVLVALDFASSRERVLSPELGRYRVLHFATHGALDSRHPELSGLVLSLVDESGRPQDGFLRLHDVYELRLGAELVVLSGCRTALGKEIRGEGLVGLTRGFFYAGVPRVVASLWSVEDQATAELMSRFYRALFDQGRSPAAALRAAQVSMWRDRRFRNPYYWAAFVHQGN